MFYSSFQSKISYEAIPYLQTVSIVILFAIIVLSPSATAMSCSDIQPDGQPGFATTLTNVTPLYCENWQSGDAGQECVANLGYDFGLKLETGSNNGVISGACDAQGSCQLDPEFDNFITVFNNDGVFFDWLADPSLLGAIVVKGGSGVNVFTYTPSTNSDANLYAPMKANGNSPRDISHIAFCWNRNESVCYTEETAWAFGSLYSKNKGSWAMFVDYFACDKSDGLVDGKCQVDILAGAGDGIGFDAGFAVLETDGNAVEISIQLENNFVFYYDLGDEENDENLKVQGYDAEPNGNPPIGRFDHKINIPVGANSATLNAPYHHYFGIHLDVAVPGDCDIAD